MGIWYITREAVKAALDIKDTSRSDGQVDRAIEAHHGLIIRPGVGPERGGLLVVEEAGHQESGNGAVGGVKFAV